MTDTRPNNGVSEPLLSEENGSDQKAAPSSKVERTYYIDWLRIVAIYIVVAFHVVQAMGWVGCFSTEKGTLSYTEDGVVHSRQVPVRWARFEDVFRAAAIQVGMPLFFHITGRGAAYSRTVGIWSGVKQRFMRLMLPFFVAYVLLIPTWMYIDQTYDFQHKSIFYQKENFFKWIWMEYTTGRFVTHPNPAWLWFLPALFLIGILNAPIFLAAEGYGGSTWRIIYVCSVIVIQLAILLTEVLALGFNWSYGIFSVIGPFLAMGLTLWAPLRRRDAMGQYGDITMSDFKQWAAIRLFVFGHIVTLVGLVVSFKYDVIDPKPGPHTPATGVPFMTVNSAFYMSGFFVERWRQGYLETPWCQKLMATIGGLEPAFPPFFPNSDWRSYPLRLYYLVIMVFAFIIIFASSPPGDVEGGRYLFPTYSASWEDCPVYAALDVLGAFAYISVAMDLAKIYRNVNVSPTFFKHATASTLVVYIFHWMFLKPYAFWFYAPMMDTPLLRTSAGRLGMCLIAYILAIIGSLGVYWLILKSKAARKVFGV